MLLFLVRHGIAIDREDPKCPAEAERYLTEEGIKKTREVARGVAAIAGKPDLFLSSPYVRAMQTAHLFAAAMKYRKQKIRKTNLLLPGSDVAAFFRELARDKNVESVFCFGHAPHLDEVIAAALGSKRDATSLKKAGAACLELRRVAPPSGTLVWLATPKMLKKLS
ncbi:MAG: phosphohistidine phosphatase SixA [Acidobacteria bacterium]|nr:phosphohistidine phosphatase SixA [Acidobacteriota bacterium]MBS1867459.1 phosphohistidine phosphatase SixA [Acidobacteriota bacterium]